MLRKIEKNAKNKEEALKLAAEEFGVDVSELSYEVEREVGKGLMGLLLGREVVISAWITKEAEQEAKVKEIAKKRSQADKIEKGENPYAPKAEPQAKDHAPRPKKVKEEIKQEEKKPARKSHPVTEKSIEDAKFFASELVHKMGLSDAEINASNGGDFVKVEVSGPKMGLLIGKRGDTLDAVQYLTSLYVNKEKNSYIKVNVDTENYRSKREDTLVKLAKSLERRVIREGGSVTLEPMSPNERRIIHAALQHSSRVKTYSVGDEPNRKIVVEAK